MERDRQSRERSPIRRANLARVWIPRGKADIYDGSDNRWVRKSRNTTALLCSTSREP